MTKQKLAALIAAIMQIRAAVDDETALTAKGIYPDWRSDTEYAAGDRVRYEEDLYKCLQSHTSQAEWTPTAAPSLWTKVLIPDPEVIPDWERPDSTNGYMTGDKVRYNGEVYESLIDNNIWSPEEYPGGWRLLEE